MSPTVVLVKLTGVASIRPGILTILKSGKGVLSQQVLSKFRTVSLKALRQQAHSFGFTCGVHAGRVGVVIDMEFGSLSDWGMNVFSKDRRVSRSAF